MKTVLASNAPWPKPEPIKKKKSIKVKSMSDLDYLLEAREQIQSIKNTPKPRKNIVTTGRFKGNNRLSG